MEQENQRGEREPDILLRRTVRLRTGSFGLALGVLCGLVVFVATVWLLIKGGDTVGPHLQLLSQFFIGYSVSYAGSIVGFFYGFAVGTMAGSLFGWVYNRIARG